MGRQPARVDGVSPRAPVGMNPIDQRREDRMVMSLLAVKGGTLTLLWLLAAVLVIAGIVSLVRGQILAGIVLIILGLLVGPGGVSIF
jgi:hypothetical protein